jgi:hypothetical protein
MIMLTVVKSWYAALNIEPTQFHQLMKNRQMARKIRGNFVVLE